MSIVTRIEIADDTPIIRALSQLMLEGGQRAALFDAIGATLVDGASQRFRDGVDPDGVAWQQSLRAAEQSGQTLRDTGRLMSSLTYQSSRDGVEYGTNVKYAATLHFGAVIKPVNGNYLTFKIGARWAKVKQVVLPARPFLGVSKDDEVQVLKIIESFLGQAT
jgi:phage virion morphogenesis protein